MELFIKRVVVQAVSHPESDHLVHELISYIRA